MSRVEQKIPCLVDPQRECPSSCRLQSLALRLLEACCKEFGSTLEQEIGRWGYETGLADNIDARRQIIEVLEKEGWLSHCPYSQSCLSGTQEGKWLLFKRKP